MCLCPHACMRGNICPHPCGSIVVPNPTSAAEGWKLGGGGGVLVSSNSAAKQRSCDKVLLIIHTHEYKHTHNTHNHKCAFNWMSGVWGPFFVSSLLNLWTNYRHYRLQKRLPVYLSLFLFHTEPGPWHAPVHPRCGEGNESQKCCWCVSLLSTGFLGFDASQVVEGILRCPLRVEMGEVNIVIWPDCVATCFGCGLVRQPAGTWLLMSGLKGLVGFWRGSMLLWGGVSVGKSTMRRDAWCLLFTSSAK